MVARGRRTANPLLDGDGWSDSASADAYAPGLWQSGHRTNDRTIKGQNAFRLACGRACLRNHPSSVKSTLSRASSRTECALALNASSSHFNPCATLATAGVRGAARRAGGLKREAEEDWSR